MTELETMQRAKMYMDLLAQGIDPITGHPLPMGCGLDNARLGRCFSYVSGVLDKVIANGGTVGAKRRTMEFYLTPEQRAMVRLSEYPVSISDWINALYFVAGNPDMKKLAPAMVTDWLVSRGLMFKQTDENGKTQRLPTENGRRMGISTKARTGKDGDYQAVYYDLNAQRFLLDSLDAIIARNEKKE